MSDRLDRIEAGLDETRKIVESNSKAIEAWANESAEYKRQTTEMHLCTWHTFYKLQAQILSQS